MAPRRTGTPAEQRRTTQPPGAASPRGCQGTTKAGTPCRGIVQAGRAWCIVHDPARQRELPGLRAKAGAKSGRVRALRGKRRKLDSAPALVRFTSGVLQDVLAGELAPEVGRCVLYGVSVQRSLVEVSDLDSRLRALEERLTTTEGGHTSWSA